MIRNYLHNFYRSAIYTILISLFALVGIPSSKAQEVKDPNNLGKMRFENFLVSIVTGNDKNGKTMPPYLIITEQRFIGEIKQPYASLSTNTSEVLMASLLASQQSSIQIGDHKVSIIRCVYQFKPPAEKYVLRRENFQGLKDSFPFLGLIIGKDGQPVQGDIHPLPNS